MSSRSSPYAACFRPSPSPPSMPTSISPHPHPHSHSNLTTAVYETPSAAFSVTWSRSRFSRSLLLQSHLHPPFLLHLTPFSFWSKSGSKLLSPSLRLFWDFSRARFGSSPDPLSGFFLALLLHDHFTLLLGDLLPRAFSPIPKFNPQSLVLKTEQVLAHKIFSTRATIGGQIRQIRIDCGHHDPTRLCFAVDDVLILEVKHLKWKFRGNEKVDVEGVPVQISWDVYNWVFPQHKNDAHAIFMFTFQHDEQQHAHTNGIMVESRRTRFNYSSSSSSFSSSSSVGSSSVLDWTTVEESELGGGPSSFSLLIYAWKK